MRCLFILPALLILCSTSLAGPAAFTSINLVFEDDLKGTAPDRATFARWSEMTGQPAQAFGDQDIEQGKELLLKRIKDAVKASEVVQFNYSGHGHRQEIEPGVYGPNVDARGKPCAPNILSFQKCEPQVLKSPKYDYYITSGPFTPCMKQCQLTNPTPELKRCEDDAVARATAHDASFTCKHQNLQCRIANKGNEPALEACKTKLSDCLSKLSPWSREPSWNAETAAMMTYNRLTLLCREKETKRAFALPCTKTCFDRYAITPKELGEALKGKKVFGVIDACYSEGFTENLNLAEKLIIASASSDEASGDSEEGGRLISYLDNHVGNVLCKLSRSASANEMSVGKFFGQSVVLDHEAFVQHTTHVSKAGTALEAIDYLRPERLKCPALPSAPSGDVGTEPTRQRTSQPLKGEASVR